MAWSCYVGAAANGEVALPYVNGQKKEEADIPKNNVSSFNVEL